MSLMIEDCEIDKLNTKSKVTRGLSETTDNDAGM